jgi:hypothetical protein
MKTKLFPLMAIAVLLVSGGWASYGQKETKWDYTVIHTMNGADVQSQLNNLGAAGWQLVSVTELRIENSSSQSFVTIYLKRAK